VLNTGFWRALLLARDVFTTDQLTDGRLELAGHRLRAVPVRADRVATAVGGPAPGSLEETVAELLRLADDATFVPRPAQRPRPPVVIGGHGDRVLRLAATQAGIVSFTGARSVPGDPPLALVDTDSMEERERFVRAAAAGRDVEFNVAVQDVASDGERRRAAERFGRLSADLIPGARAWNAVVCLP
jgi:alkanesulfonate monooxygenase SsuD/methylene tetrahydromethanopterin reductase-like flavin-dependent oxidoreductase (luciferase family)